MTFCKKEMVLFFMVVMAAMSVCMGGAEYTVGDDRGWNIGVDFTNWANSHSVKVGDTIVFKYKKREHNVVQVKEVKDFNSCKVTAAKKTGNDKIYFQKNGHYYYLSSLKDDCKKGLKLYLRVVKSDGDTPKPTPSPKSSPAHPPLPPPSVPEQSPPKEDATAPAPGPAVKNAAVSLSSLSVVGIMAMGLAY